MARRATRLLCSAFLPRKHALLSSALPRKSSRMSERLAYIRDGAAIYERSFAIIRAEADLARFSPEEERVAVRIIHATGMIEITKDIVFSTFVVATARDALATGASILCDSKMVANGVTR